MEAKDSAPHRTLEVYDDQKKQWKTAQDTSDQRALYRLAEDKSSRAGFEDELEDAFHAQAKVEASSAEPDTGEKEADTRLKVHLRKLGMQRKEQAQQMAQGGSAKEAEIISKVSEFYYDSEELEDAMMKFAEAHCESFDAVAIADGEFSLQHSEIHAQFQRMFEGLLEDFVLQQGVDVDCFFSMVAADSNIDSDTRFESGGTFAAVVNSAMSFKSFVILMRDAKAGEMIWGIPPLQDSETGEMIVDAE
jgi:hypothetical protein